MITDMDTTAIALVVASAIFTINFIMAGLGRVAGLFFVSIMETYHVNRTQAALSSSIRAAIRPLSGVVTGVLGQRFSIRKIVVAGSILTAISSSLCIFATDFIYIIILWGIFGGFGTSLLVSLLQLSLCQYFSKHRATATGITVSGGCFGSVIFSYLVEYLLNDFGLNGTFLIIGGIILNTLPAALMLRKPSGVKHLKNQNNGHENVISSKGFSKIIKRDNASTIKENSVSDCRCDIFYLSQHVDIILNLFSIEEKVNYFVNDKQCIGSSGDLCLKEALINFLKNHQYSHHKDFVNLGFSENEIFEEKMGLRENLNTTRISESQNCSINYYVPKVHELQETHLEILLFKLGKVLSAKDFLSMFPENKTAIISIILKELKILCSETDIPINSVQDSNELSQFKDWVGNQNTQNNSKSFLNHIENILRQYRNPLYFLTSLTRMIEFFVFVPLSVTIVDFAMDKGLTTEDGRNLIVIVSVSDFFGRVGFGWVTDKNFISVPRFLTLFMVIHGCNIATLPFLFGKEMLYISCGIFGVLHGSLFTRHFGLVLKYVPSAGRSVAMGSLDLFSGFAALLAPVYIGYFRDSFGTYNYVLFINGALMIVVGLLWTLEPFLLLYLPHDNNNINNP